mmetsp:Transcript_43341/g.87675  ORF Transcript_43341/g.87675 Transcript_43341/m.87675 type:complete len:248 (-) Transcript_43341:808-1551(-)
MAFFVCAVVSPVCPTSHVCTDLFCRMPSTKISTPASLRSQRKKLMDLRVEFACSMLAKAATPLKSASASNDPPPVSGFDSKFKPFKQDTFPTPPVDTLPAPAPAPPASSPVLLLLLLSSLAAAVSGPTPTGVSARPNSANVLGPRQLPRSSSCCKKALCRKARAKKQPPRSSMRFSLRSRNMSERHPTKPLDSTLAVAELRGLGKALAVPALPSKRPSEEVRSAADVTSAEWAMALLPPTDDSIELC